MVDDILYGKEALYDRIRRHGEIIKKIFKLNKNVDPVKLCKRLRRVENKAQRISEAYCNADIGSAEFERGIAEAEKSLNKILNYKRKKIPVFINTDPRGYALKIKSEYASKLRQRGINIPIDWGGYGLIAPDLRQW